MNKKKKWIITAVILVVFRLALGLYNLMNGKGAAEPDADAAVVPRRASILNVNGLVIRPQQLTDGITTVGNLLPDEEAGPLVRDLGQDRGDQFQGGHRRQERRPAGQGERPAAAGPAPPLRGAAQTGRGPRIPPERPPGERRRQPGSLRAGPHGAGDAQRRHRHREIEHRAHGASRTVRRRDRPAERQRGRLRLAERRGGRNWPRYSR